MVKKTDKERVVDSMSQVLTIIPTTLPHRNFLNNKFFAKTRTPF